MGGVGGGGVSYKVTTHDNRAGILKEAAPEASPWMDNSKTIVGSVSALYSYFMLACQLFMSRLHT